MLLPAPALDYAAARLFRAAATPRCNSDVIHVLAADITPLRRRLLMISCDVDIRHAICHADATLRAMSAYALPCR